MKGLRSDDSVSRYSLSPLMWLGGLATCVTAFGLRVYHLDASKLWIDEAYTSYIATPGWSGIIEFTRGAGGEHPPVYYLLISPWIAAAGNSEFALRFFSLFFGILLIPLLFWFGAKFVSRRAGLWLAVVGAFAPFGVAYSREARMYTLLPLLALLSISLLLLVVRGGGRRVWALWFIVNLIGFFTHYYFGFLLLAENIFVIARRPWPLAKLLKWWLMQAVLLALPSAWLVTSQGAATTYASLELLMSLNVRTFADIVRMARDWALGYTLARQVTEPEAALALLSIALLGIGAVSWLRAPVRGHESDLRTLVLLLITIPFVAALPVPWSWTARYFSFTAPAFYVLWAQGLAWLGRKGSGGVLAGICLILPFFAVGDSDALRFVKDEYGLAMERVIQRSTPEAAIILNGPWSTRVMHEYYVRRVAVGRDAVTVAATTKWPPEDVWVAELERALENHHELWLAIMQLWQIDSRDRVERWMNLHAFQAEKDHFDYDTQIAQYFVPSEDEKPTAVGGFDGGLALADGRMGPLSVAPGDAVRVTLNWRASAKMEDDYIIVLTLNDPTGREWAKRQSMPQGGFARTSLFALSEIISDRHAIYVAPGVPPGNYTVQLRVYDPLSGRNLPVAKTGQGSGSDWLNLGTVAVLPSQRTGFLAEDRPMLSAGFGGQVELVLGTLPEGPVRQGESAGLDMLWRSFSGAGRDLTLVLRLVDGQGRVRSEQTVPPVASWVPTSQWQAGQVLRGHPQVIVPAEIPGGTYDLVAALSDGGQPLRVHAVWQQQILGRLWCRTYETDSDSLLLGRIQVTERARSYTVPTMQRPVSARFGDLTRLLGYDLTGENTVTLYWQAIGPSAKPRKTFVHLIDANGQLWGQHDAQPGNGTLPTTSWRANEVIIDPHTLSISSGRPAGRYQLAVGFYDEVTGTRLPAYLDEVLQPDGRILLDAGVLP